MKQILFAISLIAGFSSQGMAGNTDSSCRFTVREVFLMGGTVNGRQKPVEISDFKKFAPASSLLGSNFTGFNKSMMRQSGSLELAHLGIGFTLGNKGPLYRLAFGYGSGARLEGFYYRDFRKTIDTLFSPRTGRTAYVDSIYGESYQFTSASQLLTLDASAIWRSKNHRRWSVFGGAGVSFGLSINSWSEFTYSNYGYLRSGEYRMDRNESWYNSSFYSNNETTESYTNSTQSMFAVYVPLGLDFKMGTKKSFWKPVHLFYESRIRLQYYNIPELRSEMEINFYNAFGIRYNLADHQSR